MEHREFPRLKKKLMDEFGFISFQLYLANVQLVGIVRKSDEETVVITYLLGIKTGFMYEGNKLSQNEVLECYKSVPIKEADLLSYERKYQEFIDVMVPPKNNYLMINEGEAVPFISKNKNIMKIIIDQKKKSAANLAIEILEINQKISDCESGLLKSGSELDTYTKTQIEFEKKQLQESREELLETLKKI